MPLSSVARHQPMDRSHSLLQVQIPESDATQEQEKRVIEPAPAAVKDEGKLEGACEPPGDRETFGTAVAFVRNPLEAARLASTEHKLTFLLHVSGNFEDNRFT
jgi:hypothetical protein